MRVLVLCQRKRTDTGDKNAVRSTVESIAKFVESRYGNKDDIEYTFLTLCLPGDNIPDCADVKMDFNMYHKDTQQWVSKHRGYFDIIILNTCPLKFFPAHFWYGMYELLSERGDLYMMAISSTKVQNVLSNALNMDNKEPTLIMLPIEGFVLKSIELLFYMGKTNNYLRKNKVVNDIIYSYLLDESCSGKTLVLLFPILPKELQDFILDVAHFSILYDVPRNEELGKILINKYKENILE